LPFSGARNLSTVSFVGTLIKSPRLAQTTERALRIIKVATDDGNAYHDIVSRLKKTNLKFESVPPDGPLNFESDLVLTSRKELGSFGNDTVAIEDLHKDPLVMEGQLLSRLVEESRRDLLVGIDPGSRIGMAVFYGGRQLGALTAISVGNLVDALLLIVREVPHSTLSVKIGAGEPKSSRLLASLLRDALPQSASVEIVDESGTSAPGRGMLGATRDQRAAARIAHRKGVQFSPRESSKRTPA